MANESFHPNESGHRRIADLLLNHLRTTHPANTFPIGQDQTITSLQGVPTGTGTVSFLTRWPGSDVQMSLTDPAGHRYTRAAPGGARLHSNGAGSELFTFTDPTPGTWTVTLFGAQIAPGGENVTLTVTADQPLNQVPIAAATAAANVAGTTVTYDGRGSSDPDGTIVTYEWDFGDGTTGTGAVVTHTSPTSATSTSRR